MTYRWFAHPGSNATPDGARNAAAKPLISLVNVSRVYRDGHEELRALDGVSLDIAAGEYVAIMGTSGSGKSTLMNVIGCLDRPTSGTYRFAGHDVGRMSDAGRTLLRSHAFGFVFQHFNLLPRTAALAQVELPLIYQHTGHRRERATRMLTTLGLGQRLRHRPTELSGGQQQRVAIARALVTNPRVILADEPTGALDTRTGMEIMEVLTRLVRKQGITVILVTHEATIAAYADRILRMRDGQIVEDTRTTLARAG